MLLCFLLFCALSKTSEGVSGGCVGATELFAGATEFVTQ
jgi:hypothetical protein